MANRYRAGAIGRTGRGNFGHGLHTCYDTVDHVDLVALADDDDEGRADAARATGVGRTYADYREMLEKEDLDLVSVCPRWVDCHEDMITAALEAGCHVYSEKPMTATPESADRVIDLADRKGLKIAVAHQAAYLPQVRSMLEDVRQGRIGTLVSIRSAGKCDHRGGGEDLIVLGTHLFNLMQIVAGAPESVLGHVTVDGRALCPDDVREAGEPVGAIAGDSVMGMFAFSGGVTGHFESRKRENRDGRPYGMEIRGSEGAIAFDASAGQMAILEDDAFAPWDADQKRTALPYEAVPLMQGNVLAVQDLIEAIEQDREPISSARRARTALEMILGIYASEVSRQRVDLPLEDRRHPLVVWANCS